MEGNGIPIGLHLDSSQVHELKAAPLVLASVRVPRLGPGRPKSKPQALAADRGYDSLAFRQWLKTGGIEPVIPHRYRPNLWNEKRRAIWLSRWKVERCFSWFNGFRRLNLRWEYYSYIHLAFLHLAAALICLRRLLQ